MRFIKMHGLGNDFVILDLRDGTAAPSPQKIAGIANRKTGHRLRPADYPRT
jgi:diaminopimelate epimerase